ncbi:hypothetical protein BaRGS_00021353 [Batillaria attramentaria]|uniref:Uncharacterized protein n=1 Tax=Batillaria attramentaria TaxID=370345 RepID=A0ABD0KJH9_9CAEN
MGNDGALIYVYLESWDVVQYTLALIQSTLFCRTAQLSGDCMLCGKILFLLLSAGQKPGSEPNPHSHYLQEVTALGGLKSWIDDGQQAPEGVRKKGLMYGERL